MPVPQVPSLQRQPSIHPGDQVNSADAAQTEPNNTPDAAQAKSSSFFSRVKSFGGATLSTIGKTLSKCVELALTGIQKAHNYIGSKITKDNAGAAFFTGLALSVGGIAGMALGGPAGAVLGIGSLCVGLSMMHHAGMTNERYASLFRPTDPHPHD
jgi:hypothetical protein